MYNQKYRRLFYHTSGNRFFSGQNLRCNSRTIVDGVERYTILLLAVVCISLYRVFGFVSAEHLRMKLNMNTRVCKIVKRIYMQVNKKMQEKYKKLEKNIYI